MPPFPPRSALPLPTLLSNCPALAVVVEILAEPMAIVVQATCLFPLRVKLEGAAPFPTLLHAAVSSCVHAPHRVFLPRTMSYSCHSHMLHIMTALDIPVILPLGCSFSVLLCLLWYGAPIMFHWCSFSMMQIHCMNSGIHIPHMIPSVYI